MAETVLAWHFLRDGRRLRNGRLPPKNGSWLKIPKRCPIWPCVFGLHASTHPADAFFYARAPILCRVECRGEIKWHKESGARKYNKLVCRERKILWRKDITTELLAFTLWCARDTAKYWPHEKVPGIEAFLADGTICPETYTAARNQIAKNAAFWAREATIQAIEAHLDHRSLMLHVRNCFWAAGRVVAVLRGKDFCATHFYPRQRRKFAQICNQLNKEMLAST